MANGVYGIKRPADFNPLSAEVFYTYKENRSDINLTVNTLNAVDVLSPLQNPETDNYPVGGLYNLNLPTEFFGAKGHYTVYIRPREIQMNILDCGILTNRTDVRGVIFDLSQAPSELAQAFENNGLIGYRMEYRTDGSLGRKIPNLFRIITSNFRVEPISENTSTASQKTIRYRLNDNSSLVFCTITPSASNGIQANTLPFIGFAGQSVRLSNTFFDPVAIHIDVVEHDADTLAYAIYGNQTKSVSDGIITYYDEDNNIFRQVRDYDIKNEFNGNRLFNVRERLLQTDFTKNFDDIRTDD